MEGYGVAYGAITVINAFATGIGAAIGVDLKVEVYIKKSLETRIETYYRGKPLSLDLGLVKKILDIFRDIHGFKDRVKVYIDSEIPPEKGLKSSSAVANALILALYDYLDIEFGEREILELNVSASLKSGVSLTGALDDAAASLIGGLVVTDNIGRRILLHKDIGEYDVLITYPERRIATSSFRDVDFSPIKGLIHDITNLLLEGEWETAMTLNGFVYTVFLGYDTKPIHLALRGGVEAVSLSGKGPAYAAVTGDLEILRKKWEKLGWRLIVSSTR